MIRDKAKVILTVFISLLLLGGCSSAIKNDTSLTAYGEGRHALPVVGAISEVRPTLPVYPAYGEGRPTLPVVGAIGGSSQVLPVMSSTKNSRLSEPLVVAAVFAIPERKSKGYGEPKIKIVSGDGMPLSAKILSRELEEKGYNIDRIDVAPYIFKKPVVFYAPGFKNNARSIAGEINAKGSIKPLSWKSIYDIIIVSVIK